MIISPLHFMRNTLLLFLLLLSGASRAQEIATSTAVRINIPSDGVPSLLIVASPTATWTPSPAIVMLEAKPEAGPVNVRADADIESDRLGTIQAGELYPVLGRRFRWLQIEFLPAPDGRAWVFEELVTVTGDEGSIPNLILVTPPAIAQAQVDATRTQAVFTRTPGSVLTMTASARILDLPGRELNLSDAEAGEDSGRNNLLPTYTYPPNLALSTATPLEQLNAGTPEARQQTPGVPERIPPAVPIALLATGGLLGLVLYSLRSR